MSIFNNEEELKKYKNNKLIEINVRHLHGKEDKNYVNSFPTDSCSYFFNPYTFWGRLLDEAGDCRIYLNVSNCCFVVADQKRCLNCYDITQVERFFSESDSINKDSIIEQIGISESKKSKSNEISSMSFLCYEHKLDSHFFTDTFEEKKRKIHAPVSQIMEYLETNICSYDEMSKIYDSIADCWLEGNTINHMDHSINLKLFIAFNQSFPKYNYIVNIPIGIDLVNWFVPKYTSNHKDFYVEKKQEYRIDESITYQKLDKALIWLAIQIVMNMRECNYCYENRHIYNLPRLNELIKYSDIPLDGEDDR